MTTVVFEPTVGDPPLVVREPSDNLRTHRWLVVLSLFGPAFVASVAYIDPGNFATNFEAGGRFGYSLLWVVAAANGVAMVVQYLAAKVGIATGSSLSQLCRQHLPASAAIALWLQAELVAMATDAAEFVGCAVGLNMLFHVPLPVAAGLTAVIAFAILRLQCRDHRRYEVAIVGFILIVGLGLCYDVLRLGPSSRSIADGLVPSLDGHGSLVVAVAIVGATVMPHAIYLHSSLTTTNTGALRTTDRTHRLRAEGYDTVVALGLAGVINLAMLAAAARLLHRPGSDSIAPALSLATVHSALLHQAGGTAALAFAVALFASGAASSSVGTHAGQAIMSGFTNRSIPLGVRRLVTMLPSVVILVLGVDPTRVLIGSQLVLSFGIPFALIPLVALSANPQIMGDLTNRRATTYLAVAISVLIVALNVLLLMESL